MLPAGWDRGLFSVLGRLRLGFGHLGEDAGDLLLLVVALPELVELEDVFGDLLDLVHVHRQLGVPGAVGEVNPWRTKVQETV